MLRKKSESIEWLEFEQLLEFPKIKQGVFLKGGSEDFFLHDEKQQEQALVNCKKVHQIVGCEHLIQWKQCHGIEVADVSNPESGRVCDGLITQKKGFGLLIKHADCQAAIFYDPVNDVIGNVHAGWRGTVQNIYKEAIDRMGARYQSKAADLLVCISPSLGPCCAEFKNYREEFPKSFWEYQGKENYFNLWEIAKRQLLEYGVLAAHIEIAGLCTVCHRDDFYSYRRDKTTCRNGTIVSF